MRHFIYFEIQVFQKSERETGVFKSYDISPLYGL